MSGEEQGTPVAVTMNPEQDGLYRRQERHELFEAIRAVDEQLRGADPAEIEAEIAAAVADVRREKRRTKSARRV